MRKAKLELIKTAQREGEEQPKQIEQPQAATTAQPETADPESQPPLAPEEAAEVARFKALTAARAAQKFMIRRIMAELEGLDDISSAA